MIFNIIRRNIALSLILTTLRRPLSASASCSQNSMEESACNVKGVYSIAYVTVPSEDVGKTLGRKIVENKLAACVNIVPQITSIYEWKDEIQEDSEFLLMIKTRTSRIEDLITYVRANHPYEVCEVISVPIDNGNPPYLKWISEIVPPQK